MRSLLLHSTKVLSSDFNDLSERRHGDGRPGPIRFYFEADIFARSKNNDGFHDLFDKTFQKALAASVYIGISIACSPLLYPA